MQDPENIITQSAPHAPQTTSAPEVSNADTTAPGPAEAPQTPPHAPHATHAPQTAAVIDEQQYTLTVNQARSIFAAERRKVPAERTLQIYCQEGTIIASKIKTVFGTEWLINEPSLRAYISKQPAITSAPAAPAPQEGTARDARAAESPAEAPHATQTAAEVPPAAPAPQPSAETSSGLVGETRTLAQVLIENSRLLATIEGKDALLTSIVSSKDETIATLKDNASFLREELTDRRKYSSDVKQIAGSMLQTLEKMATRNVLPEGAPRQHRNADVSPVDEIEGGYMSSQNQ